MKCLTFIKRNAALIMVMLTLGFLFTSCSEYYNDEGWNYLGDTLGDGFFGPFFGFLFAGGVFSLLIYLMDRSDVGTERERIYIDGKEHIIERIIQKEKLSHSQALRNANWFYYWVFIIALWWFVYINVLFIFRTEFHWIIDGAIALISAVVVYIFTKSNFYINNKTLVHIISFVIPFIVFVYRMSLVL